MSNDSRTIERWRSTVALIAIIVGILAAFPVAMPTAIAASPNDRYIITLVDSEKKTRRRLRDRSASSTVSPSTKHMKSC